MIAHEVRAVLGNHDRAVIAAYEQPSADGPLLWRIARKVDAVARLVAALVAQFPVT
jgi:hypothetical protein